MRPASLQPVRWDVPQCDDYESPDAVRQYEREVRVHRAHTEPFDVTPLGAGVDGGYAVASGSGGRYVVDLVDGSARYDTCSCPDFLGNQLGTCKHLEAVRRAVAERPAWRRALARLAAPARPTVTVDARDGLRLRAVGAWPDALRAERARLVQPFGLLKALAEGAGAALRVVHAAEPAAERLALSAWHRRRRRLVEAWAARGDAGMEALRLPLFPYQREGVLHLVRSGRALLADDMGLGKTIQAIAACELLRRRGEARRVLIVTAASLKHQWAQEIARWTGERAAVLGGSPAQRTGALAMEATYTVLSYEITWRELTRLKALGADVLVLDEAQRAKNFRTKTAATLRALPSRFLFILTGTPVENRLDDLYALLQLVDPALLGPLWRFNLDFHRQDERGRIAGYKNLGELRRRVAPVVLRRERAEVLLELPPLVEQTRYTPLSPEQRELEGDYRAQAARLLAITERRALRKEEVDRLMMLLLKARQACNALELCDPRRRKRASSKLDELEALVAEITAQPRGKVIVFSEWVGMLALAAERLDRLGVGYAVLHGDVPTDRRPALLDRFREDAAVRVLLSTDAGGVGLNLQAASYVVHLDLPWNPARLDQRTARAHRMGQARGVSVTYLCAEEGIERGIERILAGKRAVLMASLRAGATVEELAAPSFSVALREMREVVEAAEEGAAVEGGEAAEEGAALPAEGDVAGARGARALLPGWLGSEGAPANDDAAAGAAVAQIVAEGAAPAALLARAAEASGGAAAEASGGAAAEASGGAAEASGGAAAEARGDRRHAEGPRVEAARRAAHDRLRLAHVVLDAGFAADAARAAYEALAGAISGLLEGPAPESHAALVAVVYRELVPRGGLPVEAHAVLARLHDLGILARAGVPLDATLARSAVDEAATWIDRLGAGGAQRAAEQSAGR
ncbi:SNF2 family helicase [Sorangium cellulosum]|uniref:SNF2 family helicase n=1 Tax=Sorangium cellulosum TaxID=56 RepID=A0A4P2Q950_SORCE|nr:DEAD/DEAH box helicase [Sorangium cellulosum]AUX26144.1 SNF2 family helicase [Sorangium cellulosum]